MNLLNLEDEKFKDIEVRGYKFKIRYISPLDRLQITQQRVALQLGNPVESFTQDDFMLLESVAIVNICTEELPKGYNQNESCIKWDDLDLIFGVASEIRKHTNDIESKLKKNKPVGGSE
jgi:hypothetical protein